MRQSNIHRRVPGAPNDIEHLLNERYRQLMAWGLVLTRGDAEKAEDIVQDLCLYFSLKKPDLSNVENMDGYLYTSLRHIYLSNLARASREAARFVNVSDFDSFDFAVTSKHASDPLQQQNDLRRICSYSVWRKERSKTASYFILHFFHGYSRREIADLARLPLSAIYNKLKLARAEIKSHLEDSGKIRMIDGDTAPHPPRLWRVLSAIELFRELRNMILRARMRECLAEEELLTYYSGPKAIPIPCSLLSHIVSCERCLNIIDSHFKRPGLINREPLDSVDSMSEPETLSQVIPIVRPMERIRRRFKGIFEHRPATLSIALNGKIIASHDVQSPRSTLSARIATPARDQFIEVFSEQDVRFALLSIEDLPPDGPTVLEHRIDLSDARWLKLHVTFDGQGMHSEVTYFDEALGAYEAFASNENTESETIYAPMVLPLRASLDVSEEAASRRSMGLARLVRVFLPSPVFAWALTLALIVGGVGYLVLHHQHQPLNPHAILDRSVQAEAAELKGKTEHKVLRVEELATNGHASDQGTIEVWKDGDDTRYIRRLYDRDHRLVAVAWKNKNGTHSLKAEGRGKAHDQNVLVASDAWEQDLSAAAFRRLGGTETLSATSSGYALTTTGPILNKPYFTATTLILDKNFAPVRQDFEIQNGRRQRRIRLTQISLERKASDGVPDSVFEPNARTISGEPGPRSSEGSNRRELSDGTSVRLSELQIAVLYQLSNLHADIGEPIELTKADDGRLRVTGSVTDAALRLQIINKLKSVEDSNLLDLRLNVPGGTPSAHVKLVGPGDTSVYEVGDAKPMIEPVLRKYFQSKNTQEEKIGAATSQYSQSVLIQSQRALQDSYALSRLSNVLSASELGSINQKSRKRWTEMVKQHSDSLLSELKELRHQLESVASSAPIEASESEEQSIENADQFTMRTGRLLHQMQDVNRDIGILFTASPGTMSQGNPSELLTKISNALPLPQANEIDRFAQRLSQSNPRNASGEAGEGDVRKR